MEDFQHQRWQSSLYPEVMQSAKLNLSAILTEGERKDFPKLQFCVNVSLEVDVMVKSKGYLTLLSIKIVSR